MLAENSLPKVTIFVLTWNGCDLLRTCLRDLAAQTYPHLRVVVIDNASTDDSLAFIAEHYPQVEVIANAENLGFSRGMNVGLRSVTERTADHLILLLNNDIYCEPDWIASFVTAWQSAENVGVAGCTLINPETNDIQHAGGRIDRSIAASHHLTTLPGDPIVDVEYVTGAAFLFAANTLDQVGLLDEFFTPFYFEEVDYCYRVRAAGKRVLLFSNVQAEHDESTTVLRVRGLKAEAFERNRLRFVLKHYSAEQFTDTFMTGECARLQQPQPADHLHVLRQALTETILHAPQWLAGWERSADVPTFVRGLLQLRDMTLRSTATTPRTHLFEYRFQPSLAGRLRQLWHAVAGKWALRNTQQQQIVLNKGFVEHMHGHASAAEIQQLLAYCAELEARVQKLEAAKSD